MLIPRNLLLPDRVTDFDRDAVAGITRPVRENYVARNRRRDVHHIEVFSQVRTMVCSTALRVYTRVTCGCRCHSSREHTSVRLAFCNSRLNNCAFQSV